jgi:hypothetical protein
MFLESVNRPLMLRTGLPAVDAALGGGIRHGPIHDITIILASARAQELAGD